MTWISGYGWASLLLNKAPATKGQVPCNSLDLPETSVVPVQSDAPRFRHVENTDRFTRVLEHDVNMVLKAVADRR